MTTTISLHHGDCIALLRNMPNASVDMVLCDPPYGTTRNAWDAVIPFEPMWSQLRRVTRPGGAMVFTASQPFSSALVMSNPGAFRHEWVWRKNKASGHLNAKRAPMKAHELVLVFCDRQPVYTPQMTSGHEPMAAYYTGHNGKNYGAGKTMAGGGSTLRYPKSVQDFPVINNDDPEKIHSTQKPVALMKYLLATYSRPGDTVLDIAMGSGSTGIACLELGRAFVGMDKDAAIFEAACARLARRAAA